MVRSDGPGVEEYVTARGADLLRTAWYLTGDDLSARDLVARVLGRQLPHWHQLTHEDVGALDTHLRRLVVQTYLTGRGEAHRIRNLRRDPPPATGGLNGRLRSLPRPERAALTLRVVDELPVDRVAELLDVPAAAAGARIARALGELGLTEERAQAALPALAPPSPPTEGLATVARTYAGRRHRVRSVASSAAAVVALAAVAVVASVASRPSPAPPDPPPASSTTPRATFACDLERPPAVLTASAARLSRTVEKVLVCPRTDPDSVWAGSLPPDDPVVEALALDALRLDPRTDGRDCSAGLPAGPAFRLLLLGHNGTMTAYANEGLACGGWPALSSYYVALAEQRAFDVPAAPGYLGCPSVLSHTNPARLTSTTSTPAVRLSKGTVFTVATACWHPVVRGDRVPRFRNVRGNVLGEPQLAQLNAAIAQGSGPGRLPACADATALIVLRAMTSTGRLVELSTRCSEVMSVEWSSTEVWQVSREVSTMLRALLVAE